MSLVPKVTGGLECSSLSRGNMGDIGEGPVYLICLALTQPYRSLPSSLSRHDRWTREVHGYLMTMSMFDGNIILVAIH